MVIVKYSNNLCPGTDLFFQQLKHKDNKTLHKEIAEQVELEFEDLSIIAGNELAPKKVDK